MPLAECREIGCSAKSVRADEANVVSGNVVAAAEPVAARPYHKRRFFTPEECLALTARFWSKVDQSAGPEACWPWKGALSRGGYGQWHPYAKVHTPAHRFALILALGRNLGAREVAMHLCETPPCCNPAHLVAGPHRMNNFHANALANAGVHGERNGTARLTADQVIGYRTRAAAEGVRGWLKDEAARIGVHPSHLRSVIRGLFWSHLPGAVKLRKPCPPSRYAEVRGELGAFLGAEKTPLTEVAVEAVLEGAGIAAPTRALDSTGGAL